MYAFLLAQTHMPFGDKHKNRSNFAYTKKNKGNVCNDMTFTGNDLSTKDVKKTFSSACY